MFTFRSSAGAAKPFAAAGRSAGAKEPEAGAFGRSAADAGGGGGTLPPSPPPCPDLAAAVDPTAPPGCGPNAAPAKSGGMCRQLAGGVGALLSSSPASGMKAPSSALQVTKPSTARTTKRDPSLHAPITVPSPGSASNCMHEAATTTNQTAEPSGRRVRTRPSASEKRSKNEHRQPQLTYESFGAPHSATPSQLRLLRSAASRLWCCASRTARIADMSKSPVLRALSHSGRRRSASAPSSSEVASKALR
mmetsp:Transcript_25275/g.84399  ORF Transcript_25275/g.84399 Transcript_25275/m.84399 type:complete len:249 (-) Transcript_25275:766-1512(-)